MPYGAHVTAVSLVEFKQFKIGLYSYTDFYIKEKQLIAA